MHKKKLQLLLLEGMIWGSLSAVSLLPLMQAYGASITDFQQQAQDVLGQSLKEADQETEDGDQNADLNPGTEANTVDISQTAAEVYTRVEIKSIEDYLDVVKNTHYDAWSRDKEVVLTTDLNFSGTPFVQMETFGGIFDGQGHTIRGISMMGSNSETGVFGTIQNTGLVKDLKVQGVIAPAGTQERLGGIAGYNYGTISGCAFNGSISAQKELGGIAGRNGRTGTIRSCTSSGSITGESACGGIVGYNEGTVDACINEINVNTTYQDSNITLDQLQSTVDSILQSGDLNNAENLAVNSDTGGIAGYSSGVITSCTNRGLIGYEHVGYNVGGIAGRSSGFLQGNTNTGYVKGRKDVGGICGHMQPYLSVDFAEDTLDDLDSQLNELNSLVNTGLNNADSYSGNTSNHLTNINNLTRIAEDATKGLADAGRERADQAADKINNATQTLQGSLSTFSDIAGQLSDFAGNLTSAIASFNDSFESWLGGLDLSEEDRNTLRNAAADLRTSSETISRDVETLNEHLRGPLVAEGDYSEVQKDLAAIASDYSSLKDAVDHLDNLLTAAGDIPSGQESAGAYERVAGAKALLSGNTLNNTIEDTYTRIENGDLRSGDLAAVTGQIRALNQGLDESLGNDFSQIEGELPEGVDHEAFHSEYDKYLQAKNDLNAYCTDLENIHNGTRQTPLTILDDGTITFNIEGYTLADYYNDYLREDFEGIMDAASRMGQAFSGMMQILADKAANLTGTGGMGDALSGVRGALKNYPDVTGQLTGALNALASMDLKVNGISDEMTNHGNNLYESMSQLSQEMQSLNAAMQSESGEGINNLRSITAQFDKITRTLEESARKLRGKGDSSTMEDVSDQDVENSFQGRSSGDRNEGRVAADTNAGGIAGMIGVEYDLDPETDIRRSGDSSLDYIFRAKCIVDRARNEGQIEGKNSYSGGIAGHMEMGLVQDCVNFGTMNCQGKYVGGISGYSVGLLKDNVARCDIRGSKYLGGIAGYGVTLRNNLAMVTMPEDVQYVGAIAGKVKNVDPASVSENYYYSQQVYGIDNVSYTGIAEGVSYENLQKRAEAVSVSPVRDQSLNDLQLVFKAEDQVIQVITCHYGEGLDPSRIPAVPDKDGFHGVWSRTSFDRITEDEVITADYSRVKTLLTSRKARAAGAPIIEVLGNFAKDDELTLTDMNADSGETERWMVTIPDDGAQIHEIRYLPPEDLKDPKVILIGHGKTRAVPTEKFGKYLVFEGEGQDVAFAVTGGNGKSVLLREGAIAAGGAAAAITGLVLALRGFGRRMKKKRRKREGRASGHSRG